MAMILDAFVGTLVEKMADFVTERVAMMLGVKDDYTRLKRTILGIKSFLQAAERRRLKEPILDQILAELKDVVYDADDLIDECRVQGGSLLPDQPPFSSLSSSASSSWRRQVSENFTLSSLISRIIHRYQIDKRIRSLNDKLDDIYNDIVKFKLESSDPCNQISTIVNPRDTSSLVEFDVVGSQTETATKELVKLIVQEQGNTCRVFAITGMGGIGKTTLAQNVFHDPKMQEFDLKIWVCISQTYNEIDVLQRLIRGAGGHHDEARTKAELDPLLVSTLSGRRVFLVLDDVWSADLWLKYLLNPLQFALKSSETIIRILVTTREENIAIRMKALHTHHVTPLSDETSWALLHRKVFGEENQEEIRNVQDIGLEIAKKCDGLPLAINAIAGVLTMHGSNRDEWEKVLKNKAWFMSNLFDEAFSGALYLSYDVLSSPLKQCFLYCSLFPEDATLERHELVRLWVAEGFVEERIDCQLEETAEGYYKELLRRNLLQLTQSDKAPDDYDCSKFSIMHDVMRSFAMFLSKDETLTPYKASSTKLRRIAIDNVETLSNLPDLLDKHKCLRTLLVFIDYRCSVEDLREWRKLTFLFEDSDQLAVLKRLRVLQISRLGSNIKLSSLGTVLINLRYLSFDHTGIAELPESIGSLTNLQFLRVRGILLRKIPGSIMQLHNLRCLDLEGSLNIGFIPKGIKKLGKLNYLDGFVVADPGEQQEGIYSSLKDLASLHHLRMLRIESMERAQKGDVSSLANLTHLMELTLNYHRHRGSNNGVEEVLDELCPPTCLKVLRIHGYSGRRYPKWMQSPSFGACFPSLTTLSLLRNGDLTQLPQLPPAGELPQLKHLHIRCITCVSRIGPEFLGTGAFPKLEFLQIGNMQNLKKWSFGEVLLSRLVKLEISYCPNLKALPEGLDIKSTGMRAVGNLRNLTKLTLWFNNSLETISHLPALEVLDVKDCKALKLVEKVDALQQLKVENFSTEELPQWMVKLFHERKPGEMDDFHLVMHLKEKALRRCLKGGPDWFIVETIPSFNAKERGGNGFIRYTRTPFSYETNLNP